MPKNRARFSCDGRVGRVDLKIEHPLGIQVDFAMIVGRQSLYLLKERPFCPVALVEEGRDDSDAQVSESNWGQDPKGRLDRQLARPPAI